MTQAENTSQAKDFRGLTIFELLAIAVIILGSIFWALSARSGMQNKAYDEQRKGRVTTLRENLMTLVQKNSSFPSGEQFQNDDSRKELFATYLADYGQDFLHDPKDKNTLISYIAEPEECAPDTDIPCTKITVALKLSNGDQFIKFGIQPGKELQYLKEASQTDQTTNRVGPE